MFPAARSDIRYHVAGSASATGRRACAEAVEQAIAALGQEAGLVLIFPAGDVDPDVAAREAQAAAGGAHVAGMTGTGAIEAHRLVKTGCSAIAFSSSFSAGIGAVEGGDPRAAG